MAALLRSGSWRRLLCAAHLALVAAACAPATPPEVPATQPAEPPRLPSAPAPVAVPPASSPLPEAAASVPPPPAECQAHDTQGSSSCPGSFRERLDLSLSEADPLQRDRGLAELEACPDVPLGWVRALRVEFAPVRCGDTMIAGYFAERSPATISPELRSTLVGLALAARLARLDSAPPVVPVTATKREFSGYFERTLAPWVSARAEAIHELSVQGSRLHGYGRGVVAVAAATADLSFVQMAREVPLPEEMAKDALVRDEYYAALDLALEPRKTRGRDAALVGLDAFYELGVMASPRVDRARQILSRSYAGQRIQLLDDLRLPPPGPVETSSLDARLALRLPLYYARALFDAEPSAVTPTLLRAFLEQGLSEALRARLDAAAREPAGGRDPAVVELHARALVALALRYWRRDSLQRAAELAESVPAEQRSDFLRLAPALSLALRDSPKDAREMMLGGPLLPHGIGDVTGLDRLGEGSGELAAMAVYDAATLLSLLPPTESVREFWRGIAARYELAARRSHDATLKADASVRAQAAHETARAARE